MIIAIPSFMKLAKKEKEEGIGEKVEVEKTNDSLATITGASGEDKKADAALAEEQKTDDSPSLEAAVEDNLKDVKELISESPAISVTETASDAPKIQSQEPLGIVTTGEQNQPEALKETQILEVLEKSQEPEKESKEKGHVEEPDINATPESSVETIEKTTRGPDSNAIGEAGKETANNEAGPTENPIETETQSGEKEQPNTVTPATSVESTEKPGDIQPPRKSDNEILEAAPMSADGEKKPIGNLQVAEEVKEQSEIVEAEQQLVGESTKSEGISDDIQDPALISKEEEQTSDTPQVSLHTVANEVESSSGITENVVEEDGKKEPSGKDVNEGMSAGSGGVLENPERGFVNQEAKTDLQEKEDSSAPSVEEKVAANDDKKERDARDVVEGLSREVDAVTITEEEQGELESAKDDEPADINDKETQAQRKVDEITGAVSEAVRETLAYKFEEKEEESITSGGVKVEKETVEEPVKTGDQIPDPPTKETAAKPPQKQSNNILYKVKQSLLKAKKAITGKSPTSKTISSETKGDIQVK